MQSIERYGIVALVFLAVTIVAVIMWDDDDSTSGTVAAAGQDSPAATANARRNERPGRVGLRTDTTRSLPLGRSQPRREIETVPPAHQPTTETTRTEGTTAPRGGIGPAGGDETAQPVQDPVGPGVGQDPTTPTGLHPGGDPGTATPPANTGRATTATRPNLYEVQQGETLSEIAERELGTWKRWPEIVELNPGLDPKKVRAGVRLIMPPRGATPAPATEGTTPTSTPTKAAGFDTEEQLWRVGEGDNLWKIAAQVLGDGARWNEIAAANPGMNVDRLKLGQKIKLPAGASARAVATKPRERAVADANTSDVPKRGRVR